jgi:hypothetical protein
MTKARSLADFISDGNPLADGTISVSEVSGAAPLANPSFTGNVSVTGNVDGVDIATRDAVLTSTTTTANAALPKAGGAVTGNVTFGDNDKAIFGAGSDLEIYHSGTTSYISDVGVGDLLIQGSSAVRLGNTSGANYFKGTDGAQVQLYYGGATKLTTTATGVTITGVSAATSYTGDGSTLSKVTTKTSATGSSVVAAGTTAQRDGSPSAGMLRFNSTATSFEGYDGSAWGSIGGGASGGGSDGVFYENDQNVTTSYTIPATKNAMSTGPITVNSGATVTVSDGARYVVI